MARRTRRLSPAVLIGLVLAVVLITVVLPRLQPDVTGPGASPTAPVQGQTASPAGSALAVLAALPVRGKTPLTGYDRVGDFGQAWLDVDRNGCDTRDDVLLRDLRQARRTACKVLQGTLHDPYTRKVIAFRRGATTSERVQIDHVVALANAWRTGAQRLSKTQRERLANDPINLFAVDGPTNQAKRDADASAWLPPATGFRCTYVAHQIGVKAAYHLWVTPAERAAMAAVLQKCPPTAAPRSTLASR
jgi:Protein of unknown function (DUF1524)